MTLCRRLQACPNNAGPVTNRCVHVMAAHDRPLLGHPVHCGAQVSERGRRRLHLPAAAEALRKFHPKRSVSSPMAARKAHQVSGYTPMYLALSYDHRVIDGATAVQFLVKVKQMIEDPETLLIEG